MANQALRNMVHSAVLTARVTDMHTHLFPPSFSALQMSGADNVLTYHYLIAEAFRTGAASYQDFWNLDTRGQAEFIWARLFDGITPMSEAASGVIQIASAMGVNLQTEGLSGLRHKLHSQATDDYVDQILELAGVESVVMTNDPFDSTERSYWNSGIERDARFHAALRLDSLLNHFDAVVDRLISASYQVSTELNLQTHSEIRRFLVDWTDKMNPVYFAFSAPETFRFPEDSPRGMLLAEVILPLCRERKIPLALMIGARRQVNPALKSAGDSTAKTSMEAIERLCRDYPNNKFLVTLLSRENQHELAVTARKFGNLMPFGCWWFLNTASLVDEITRIRLELLGPTFIPQHSDARVLEHLIYKWQRARTVVANVLSDKYEAMAELGWTVTDETVARDVRQLFHQNFWDFVKR